MIFLKLLGLALILFGLVTFFAAVLGLFRFRYVLNRMHAAAMADTLGIFCVLAGTMLLRGLSVTSLKLALVLVFLWLTSPVASHLIADMEITAVRDIEKRVEVEKR